MEPVTVLIFSLITILVIEIIMSGLGVGWYYRIGIPVFRNTFPVTHFPDLSPKSLSEAYENCFKSPISFVPISMTEIGYHEWPGPSVFVSRLSKTFPLLRGLIQIDRLSNRIRVTSYINWSPLVYLSVFSWKIIHDERDFLGWGGIALFLLFFCFIFWFSWCNFSSVCWFLKDNKYR